MKKFLLTLRDILIILLLVILCQIIAGISIPSLANNHLLTLIKSDILSPLIYATLFYGGFVWLQRKVFKDSFSTIHLPPRFKKQYFAYAGGLILLISIGWMLIGVRLRRPSINSYLFWQNVLSIIFVDTLTAPFVEEIAFRGVILEIATRRYNSKVGLLVSSILFGLVHLLNGKLNLISVFQLIVAGTLMGLLLGLIYCYEHSIWANYTVHALYNLFWDLFPIQQSISHDWPIQLITKTHNQLLTGGQYGMDSSSANITAYALMILFMLYLTKVASNKNN